MTSRALISLSPTVENYLKHLFAQQQLTERRLLPMGKLAAAMGVTPGTATAMVKTLVDYGLVQYEPRDGVCLTATGERHALDVIRRHRLVELFLVQVLGLDWSEVHEEAEELEHAISAKVLERIDAVLGRPQFDPHGDPIPSAKGNMAPARWVSLADWETGRPCRIGRVGAQDASFLKMVQRLGLMPGNQIAVIERDAAAEVMTVQLDNGKTVTLGLAAATRLWVEKV
jgi:DtxR family Mn-dependent transcriptional regulator